MKNILLCFLIINIKCYSQKNKPVFFEISNASYHPLIKNNVSHYKRDFSRYTFFYDSIKTSFNGKKYYKHTADYGENKFYSYYREDHGAILYYTTDPNKETVEIPSHPSVGMNWYESDSTWKYTIRSINDTLKTPKYDFVNCLVIESEDLNCKSSTCFKKYMQYYQKGRGYVGTMISGSIYTYLEMD